MAIDGSQGQESRIFIGNVDPKIDKDKIKSRFSLHGKVSDIKVLRGYAFVQFEKSIEAQTAISRENGTIFDDKTIEVKNAVINNKVEETARPAPSVSFSKISFLKNAHFNLRINNLKKHLTFSEYYDSKQR